MYTVMDLTAKIVGIQLGVTTMVGKRELETSVLCTKINNSAAIAVEELARSRNTTISRLLYDWILDAIKKELGLKTESEILEWARDFELKEAIALRR